MVRSYLVSLKNKGNFSWSDLSNLSGLPDATIRKIFSGETADPRFETVVKLVTAMGGSLNELIECKEGEQQDMNVILAMKEVYEARIIDIKTAAAEHAESLKRDKRFLAIAVCVLGLFLIGAVLVDLFVGSIGWVRY